MHHAALTPLDIAELIDMSRSFVLLHINQGTLRATRIGRRYWVTPGAVLTWLEQITENHRSRARRDLAQ